MTALCDWFSRHVLPVTCCEHGPPYEKYGPWTSITAATYAFASGFVYLVPRAMYLHGSE